MGSRTGHICKRCGAHFEISTGGGFTFDQLHCEQCGGVCDVSHEEMGDTHLRYIKGLGGPYAVARAAMDAQIQREYPREPITEADYHAAVEQSLEACSCGGRYRYDAPPRCPSCRSSEGDWVLDPAADHVMYD